MTKPKITEDILRKYVDNQCSDQEKNAVESWYNHISKQRINAKIEDLDLESIDHYLRSAFHDKIIQKQDSKPNPLRSFKPSVYWSAAALILVFTVISLLYWQRTETGNTETFQQQISKTSFTPGTFQGTIILDHKDEAAKINQTLLNLEKTSINDQVQLLTANGEEFESILPDGTRVRMNAGSSLRITKAFNQEFRDVYLEGEAYFHVAKDPNRPFIVYVAGTKIHALGTAFNVKYYPSENPIIKTFLEKGSIQIQQQEEQFILKPGELFEHNNQSGANQIQRNLKVNQLAWKDGYFEFNDSSLPEILRELARWYNFSFEIDAAYQNKTLSGKFNRNQPFSDVIQILKFSGIDVIQNQQTLILQPNK
ncbi:hypothetical protein GCM10022216_15890 [Sphingobacterium kyonggiense]|uniref:FecR family protein n=1 Tax=Sphingobacterium kyonggiense TaxID=714075 RepID=A0ABP7YMY0_9SPHI